MWLVFALFAALMWGVGQIFVKKGFKDISPLFNNLFSTALGFIIFIPFALTGTVHFDKVLQLAPFTLLIATLFLIYYYAISHGQISLTGTVVGTYPLVVVILSLLFLHETPSLYQKIAIGLLILGTVFVALPSRLGKVHMGNWLWWALLAVFAIGTSDFLIKVMLNDYNIHTYLFTYGFSSMLVTSLLPIFDKKGRKLPKFSWKIYKPTLIGVTLIELGFFVFQLALVDGYLSLVSPISGMYVAITAVLAWVVLKEKITKVQFFGIALAALGVILVGIT